MHVCVLYNTVRMVKCYIIKGSMPPEDNFEVFAKIFIINFNDSSNFSKLFDITLNDILHNKKLFHVNISSCKIK